MHWRPMMPADLAAVGRVAEAVHPGYPEDGAVFAERLALFPAGCFVLAEGEGASGYAVSHPGLFGRPPSLNALLGGLPAAADTFYIHDVAILPAARGNGHAGEIVRGLLAVARREGLETVSLVAIKGARAFWERHGFEGADLPGLREKLAAYDGEACFMVLRLAMETALAIGELREEETDAAVALWRAVNLTRPWNDPYADIGLALGKTGSTVLAGRLEERLVATAMVGSDGHRGWVYYLAVAADRQGRGIGAAMMRAAEVWAAARGVPKIQLMVRGDNKAAIGFYRAIGYEPGDVVVLSRRLDGL